MILGPLEYILIGFESNHFSGQILPEWNAVREQGIIRLVDLLFIRKDERGNTTVMELSDLSLEEAQQYSPIVDDLLGLFTEDDIEVAANDLPNNSSAALLLVEHTWAIALKDATLKAGGVPLAGGLVTPAVMQMLEAELAAVEEDEQSR